MTKFLIVACAVLCLLLSALTVAFTANADRITEGFKQERAARLAAEATAKDQLAQAGQERADMQQKVQELTAAIRERDAQINDLQARATALQTEKERAAAEVATIKNQIDQLTATTKVQAAVIEADRQELGKLRAESLAAARREIELGDRVNDLASQNEVLEQTARALREQLAEAQTALQTAAAGGRPGAKGQPYDPAGLKVRGSVTDVIRSDAGDEMVVLDIGTNKGVQENMRLDIIRGTTWLATVVITKADPGQSVGRLDYLGRTTKVGKGDTVLSLK
jgi:hypothetical protein